MPTVTIDGQTVKMAEGSTLLQAVRQAGANLPTLCQLEGLPPYGACRLCQVELEGRRPAVVAACTFPCEDGLVVHTDGPQAVVVRRMMFEFLLARCPTATAIRNMAAAAGVEQSRFATEGHINDELCVLCGLCVRVCRDLVGAAAISFIDRSSQRQVGAPFHLQAEACIGCGACAAVCPTGAVRMEDRDGQRHLHPWKTVVPLKPCPQCGQPFAPEPTTFLQAQVPVSAELWGWCPKCRRQRTLAQLSVIEVY